MPAALTNTDISNTYVGVLHAEGQEIPASGQHAVYDGRGNKSSLSVGRENNGITVSGTITSDSISTSSLGANAKSAIVNLIYPVGAIYMSINSTSPGTLFGGTWVSVAEGKFVVGVGVGTDNVDTLTTVAGDDVGHAGAGTYKHQLTIAEMPSHTHDIDGNNDTTSGQPLAAHVSPDDFEGDITRTESAGGDSPHNNTPPWFGAYMWKRTA